MYIIHCFVYRVGSRADMLIQKLTVELTSEAQRRGALGLVGQHTGGVMLDRNGSTIQREHILNASGGVVDTDLVTFDQKTGLLMPNPQEVTMMLSDGVTSIEIPKGFFVHPVTCRLIPIDGTLCHYHFTLFMFHVFTESLKSIALFSKK